MIRTEAQTKARNGRSVSRKGKRFELEVLDELVARGIDANRTVASGARNGGGDLEMRIDPIKLEIECKHWGTKGAAFITAMRKCDALIFRNDRGKPHIVIGLDLFLDMVERAQVKR